jgi:hypothetical protein
MSETVVWTMQLLADTMVELKHAASVSGETVRRALEESVRSDYAYP